MKILMIAATLFLFTNTVFAKSPTSSVSENCSHNKAENFESSKYNNLLSFLGTKRTDSQKRRKKVRGVPTGKQ